MMDRDRAVSALQTLVMGVVSSLIATVVGLRMSLPTSNIYAIVMVGALAGAAVAALALATRLPRIVSGSLLRLDRLVVSALVIDGGEILLCEDDERDPAWFVPPATHLPWLLRKHQCPYDKLVRQVKREAGIDIRIVGEGPARLGVTPLALPVCVQAEDQLGGEGHFRHYDFYYLAAVATQRPTAKPMGKYAWFSVSDLGTPKGPLVPNDVVALIRKVYKLNVNKTGGKRGSS
jgi:hypothetical protein